VRDATVADTPLADEIMRRLTGSFEAAADPAQAVSMRAYMRDQFPFLGIRGPLQKTLAREVVAGLARPAEADLCSVAVRCWALPAREYQYFACGLLRRHAKVCSADVLGTARRDGRSLADALEAAGLMTRSEAESAVADPIAPGDTAAVRSVLDRLQEHRC